MITSYTELKTEFDGMHRANRGADYDRGFRVGSEATEFNISYSGTWSTVNKDGSSTGSYEKLGFHANTAYFFCGVVASGVKIVDHRDTEAGKKYNAVR